MEGYTSLYRKLRPSRFSDIIGQPHISRIMVNTLTSGKISHAYLFSGPRGTGKTSTAKILAKAVNCLQPEGAEPCSECIACQRIGKGRSLDVIEIDGASNRGIDEIRDLREKVRLAPAEEKNKVYIIDEVHMLTGEAFNALLKTLEEPPPRVIFVLATTEPHKVPDTILSRCLRLDFRRIPQAEIIEHLKNIIELQGIEADSEAVTLIAKMARGGLRDALSILEQCTAFNSEKITQQDVETVLGKAGDKVLKTLFDCIGKGDVAGSLTITEECIAMGSDVGNLFNDTLEYIRNLLLLRTSGQASHLIPYSSEIVKEMHRQAGYWPKDTLFEMADIVSGYSRQVRWSNQQQIILELAVIKLCEFGLAGHAAFAEQSAVREETAAAAEAQADAGQMDKKVAKENFVDHAGSMDASNSHSSISLGRIRKEWDLVLTKLKKQKVSLNALIVEGVPNDYKNGVLTIAFSERRKFHKETAEQTKNKSFLESLLQQHFNETIRVKFSIEDNNRPEEVQQADIGGVGADKQDLIHKALEVFGGELVSIEDVDFGDCPQDEEGF